MNTNFNILKYIRNFYNKSTSIYL